MKQIRGVASFTPEMRQQFEQEVNHLRSLQHPNLVEFFGAVIEPASHKLWLLTKYPLQNRKKIGIII